MWCVNLLVKLCDTVKTPSVSHSTALSAIIVFITSECVRGMWEIVTGKNYKPHIIQT